MDGDALPTEYKQLAERDAMKLKQISAGQDRSVVLALDGKAYGWGAIRLLGATLPPGYPDDICTSNATEIGHNRFAQPVAQILNPRTPFARVSDGYQETLAVCQAGTLHVCRPVVAAETGALTLSVEHAPAHAVQTVATESAQFALYANGQVWSWESAAAEQLGRIDVVGYALPGRIQGLPPITALAAGATHVLALDRQGRIWAWGGNAAGQLGLGGLERRSAPTAIAHFSPIKHIAAGDTHSFAVDVHGRLWAWGSNHKGQLGGVAQAYATQPTRVKTDFAIQQIDAGMHYSAAVSNHGDVFVWGWNGMGQLARTDVRSSAVPLRVRGLRDVRQLSAGAGHLLAAGDWGVCAWGDNRASACGVAPTTTVQAQPVAVEIA